METKREELFRRVYTPPGIPLHIFIRFYFLIVHIVPFYFFLIGQPIICINAILFETVYGYLGGLGITVGCHRYWTHKTFKANLPLQIILMIFFTISGQLTIHKWCLDHRLHHKFTDTDADPHNSKRGFWYSHIGWLVLPYSKECKEKLNTFDMSDLESDPVVRFHSRWYLPLAIFFIQVLPVFIVWYVWELPLYVAIAYGSTRLMISYHSTFCVNSLAHIWGDKPFDKSISAAENKFVSLIAAGEGWHNYHHTFPWDYRTSEFGWKLNSSAIFIDFWAKLGWAWELKTVSKELIEKRRERTGNLSLEDVGKQHNEKEMGRKGLNNGTYSTRGKSADLPYWGWDDLTIPEDFRKATTILQHGKMK